MNMNTNYTTNQPQIEAKNLHIVEDQLNYEALATKKYKQAAEMCTNQDLVNICNQCAQKHKEHFNSLLGYLNTHK